MKRLLLSLLLITVMCAAHAQADKKAILNVLERQRLAWNKGDIETFMQGYWKSDSLAFVGKSGVTYGWQNTMNNYKKSYPGKAGMGSLKFNILKVELIDKTNAFVLGGWHLTREKDTLAGYYTLRFKKINGQWLIVLDHSS